MSQNLLWHQGTPHLEYVMAIEQVCHKLQHQEAGNKDWRSIGFSNVLTPKPNFTKVEFKPIQQLQGDKNRMTLSVDNEVAMAFMGRQKYVHKAQHLLEHPTY